MTFSPDLEKPHETQKTSRQAWNIPLQKILTFEHHKGDEGNGITAERLWLTAAPLFDYVHAFCQENILGNPTVRGSTVRHAAFHKLNPRRESTRYTPNKFLRFHLLPSMQADLVRLPAHIEYLYRDILAGGSDLDIKLPLMDTQTQLRFAKGLMIKALPQLALGIGNNDYVDNQARIQQTMRQAVRPESPTPVLSGRPDIFKNTHASPIELFRESDFDSWENVKASYNKFSAWIEKSVDIPSDYKGKQERKSGFILNGRIIQLPTGIRVLKVSAEAAYTYGHGQETQPLSLVYRFHYSPP